MVSVEACSQIVPKWGEQPYDCYAINSWNIQPHGSVPASAFGVDPNVELVAELPEYHPVDASSTQLSVVQVR